MPRALRQGQCFDAAAVSLMDSPVHPWCHDGPLVGKGMAVAALQAPGPVPSGTSCLMDTSRAAGMRLVLVPGWVIGAEVSAALADVAAFIFLKSFI